MEYALANFEPSYILHAAGAAVGVVGIFVLFRSTKASGWKKVTTFGSGLIAVVAGCVLLYIGKASNNIELRLDRDALRVETAFFGGVIPRNRLRVEEARIVVPEPEADAEFETVRRTGGTGLPSLRLGWFRLANGHRAYVVLTHHGEAIYVPTVDGYDVLVSPQDPRAFLADLQNN